MELSELYQKGKEILSRKPYGNLLDGVETEFDIPHDRVILDRYTFRLKCIDGIEARTDCRVLGVALATPVIMSPVTAPISAIKDDGLMETALGLKDLTIPSTSFSMICWITSSIVRARFAPSRAGRISLSEEMSSLFFASLKDLFQPYSPRSSLS